MKDILIMTNSFLDSLLKLDKKIRNATLKTIGFLVKNKCHPSLNNEKIWEDIYTVKVGSNCRLVHQPAGQKIRCIFVGSHDDAYRFIKNLRKNGITTLKKNPFGKIIATYFRDIGMDLGYISFTSLRRLVKKEGAYLGSVKTDNRGSILDIDIGMKKAEFVKKKLVPRSKEVLTFVVCSKEEAEYIKKYADKYGVVEMRVVEPEK